jgi:hypothetical protein
VPDAWFADVIRDPGTGAGYAVGTIASMDAVKVHMTAGTNSYNIVKNGTTGAPSSLAQFLIPYDGTPWQFTEANAICYDSGPYNTYGPGVEIEAPVIGPPPPGSDLSEFRPMSASQLDWAGKIFTWLSTEWGFPLELYSGPRFQAYPGWRGFVNHADLDDQRTDGMTPDQWAQAVHPAPPPTPEYAKGTNQMVIEVNDDPTTPVYYLVWADTIGRLVKDDALNLIFGAGGFPDGRALPHVKMGQLTVDAFSARFGWRSV